MSAAARWTRTDHGAHEILTLVRPTNGRKFMSAELERKYPYLVEISAGMNVGDDFVGLFDLDGDKIDSVEVAEWEVVDVDTVPAEVIDQIERGWESGSSVVVRLWSERRGTPRRPRRRAAKVGKHVPPPGPTHFGKETNAKDVLARIKWEKWAAEEARKSGSLGHEAMAQAHDHARVEYERLYKRKYEGSISHPNRAAVAAVGSETNRARGRGPSKEEALRLIKNLLIARRSGNVHREQAAYDKLGAFADRHDLNFGALIEQGIEHFRKSPAAIMQGWV